LSTQQYERTQELAKQLAENEGPELQHHLVERQIKMQNWVRQDCCFEQKNLFFMPEQLSSSFKRIA
jgi:hypothetical protein